MLYLKNPYYLLNIAYRHFKDGGSGKLAFLVMCCLTYRFIFSPSLATYFQFVIEQYFLIISWWSVVFTQGGNLSQVVFATTPGLILGPMLFSSFINGLDYGIESTLTEFADNTKLRWINQKGEPSSRQTWTCWKSWLTRTVWSLTKCKALHLGWHNQADQ